MNQARSFRPDHLELGSRADSPMRDEANILNKSPVNGSRIHGLPTPINEAPASGFTAVNGDGHRTASFRTDESAPRPTLYPLGHRKDPGSDQLPGHQPHGRQPQPPGDAPLAPHNAQQPPKPPSTTTYQPHAWRPGEPHPTTEREPSQFNGNHDHTKRKRGDSQNDDHDQDGRRDRSNGVTHNSPKRRMTSMDGSRQSPIRIYDDDQNREGEPEIAPNDARARSPVYRKDVRTPPSPPRPAVEAQLAQSLQQQFGEGQAATGDNSAPEDDEDEDDEQEQSRGFSAEQMQIADGSDPKKNRKRNFSNRTKTGCHTCRARKKKCDEGKPRCNNCLRGNFQCNGYGPKPTGGTKITSGRSVVPLQAKQHYEQPPGPTQYFDPHYHEAHLRQLPPYHERPFLPRPEVPDQAPRFGPTIPPLDSRPPISRENGYQQPRPPPWNGTPTDHPPYSVIHDRLGTIDFSANPPPSAFPPQPPHWYPQYHQHAQPMFRPWTGGAPSHISSHHSESSGGSGRSNQRGQLLPQFGFPPHPTTTERDKMISGRPYKHYLDGELIKNRTSCKRAVEARNEACKGISLATPEERERCFRHIIDPQSRPFENSTWDGPTGHIGSHTIVQPDFDCEFGYNIHLGDKVAIGTHCQMQDANVIYIGDGTIIGNNVKFYCVTASLDPKRRNGSQGEFIAGPIKVESNVFIGADTIIMPFRTIGEGAVVGAGSVVTKDVKPYTVVAGNPAKPIRRGNIENGPNLDKHINEIQQENDEIMRRLKRKELIPKKR